MITRLAAIGTLAASIGVTMAAQAPMFTARREVVRVDVLVSNNGQPVQGLQPSDFVIRDNGVIQQVDLASFEEVPLNIVLALDMSTSVAGERLTDLRDAGGSLLDVLKPRDRVSLVTFSHLVTQRAPLTTDVTSVRDALDTAAGSGETALIDGIYSSVVLCDGPQGRGLVIVFSDGVDTASWLSAEALLDAARRSDVVVYGVSTDTVEKASVLRDVTAATGGSLLTVQSTRDLDAVFLQILDEYRHRYLVSYSPTGVDQRGWHRLEVRVSRPAATVKARPGYQKGS